MGSKKLCYMFKDVKYLYSLKDSGLIFSLHFNFFHIIRITLQIFFNEILIEGSFNFISKKENIRIHCINSSFILILEMMSTYLSTT